MSQNDVNFGPQTASNWTAIFTHPMQILLSTSLPGFADKHQQTELNQTLPNGRRYVALTICCRTVRVVPSGKMGPRNFYKIYICSVFRRLWHLLANIFWTKRDIDNRQERWKDEGSPTLSQNFTNFGPQTA